MDTLTHALSGALLARATAPAVPRPDQLNLRLRMTTGFLSAAFPDSDFVFAPGEHAHLPESSPGRNPFHHSATFVGTVAGGVVLLFHTAPLSLASIFRYRLSRDRNSYFR